MIERIQIHVLLTVDSYICEKYTVKLVLVTMSIGAVMVVIVW
jgi:hypothetical protein